MVSISDIRAAYIRKMLDSIVDMGEDKRVRPADLTMDHISDALWDLMDEDLEVLFEILNTQIEDGSLPLPPDHILTQIGRFVASGRNVDPSLLRGWAEDRALPAPSPKDDNVLLLESLIDIVVALGPQRWRFDGTQVLIAARVHDVQTAAV